MEIIFGILVVADILLIGTGIGQAISAPAEGTDDDTSDGGPPPACMG